MVDDRTIVAGYHLAPQAIRSKWMQQAALNTHQQWQTETPDNYNTLNANIKNGCSPLMLVDINAVFASEADVEFMDSDPSFELKSYVDEAFIVDEASEDCHDLAQEFADDYLDQLNAVLANAAPEGLSLREYMIYVAYQEKPESRVAELFGTAVGTIRSVIGRVNSKYERAMELQNAVDEVDHLQSIEKDVYHIEKSVLDRVTESELPVDSTALVGHDKHSYQSFASE